MKLKQLTLTLLCAALFGGCAKEIIDIEGTISGFVTDADTAEPIYGAAVLISPTNATTVTGADGSYTYSGMAAGEYKVQATKSGYETNSRQVTIIAGQNTSGDIPMTKESNEVFLSPSLSTLNFGTSDTEKTFNLVNSDSSSSTASWSMSGIPSYVTSIDPSSGSTMVGKSSAVKVTINRSQITESQNSSFIINVTDGNDITINLIITVE